MANSGYPLPEPLPTVTAIVPSTGRLRRSTAIVAVTSVPAGAEIEVDGQFLGNTPAELPLVAGERLMKLTKTGHQPWERKLQVLAGGKQTVTAELEVHF